MGGVKAAWMEAQERGWEDVPEKRACANCVSDHYLKSSIKSSADSCACDYCGEQADSDIAAPVQVLMPPVMGALGHYYAEPAGAGVPYESAEGGYLAAVTDTEDALLSLPLECDDELFQDIVQSIASVNDAWVNAAGGHWASEQRSKELLYGWSEFSDQVKHRQRYFFTAHEAEVWQGMSPSRLLAEMGDVAEDVDLISDLPKDSPLYRVRFRLGSDGWPMDAQNLGAPPAGKATAGRMNPAGISYLYLALDASTAAAEVVRNPPCSLALARFDATRRLTLLNLVDLPAVPSVFDYEQLHTRELLLFFERFVEAISRPVAKDGAEHVEYVPSQIVCEYFATVFRLGAPIDGILYPSAVRVGGRNVVLFPQFLETERFPQVVFVDSWLLDLENWSQLTSLVGGDEAALEKPVELNFD